MPTMATIRTMTLAIGDAHPLGDEVFARAAAILRTARARAEARGYTVQTTRLATRPLLSDLLAADEERIVRYAQDLQTYCDAHRVAYCSLGPAPADDPDFPLERIALLPRVLAPHPALNATVQLASQRHPARYAAALPTALAMRALAAGSGGAANFRFAALAMCAPGGPFFPQAYAARDGWTLTVGLQSAGVVRDAIAALVRRLGPGAPALPELPAAVGSALTRVARPVVELVRAAAGDAGVAFGGIDLSPAPMGTESIADAIEAVGLGPFGGPGTLAVAAALTQGVQGTDLPTCGYCGLMLPVLEDRGIGARCAEGHVGVQTLLAYSAVCGTGLDTVPIPGETPPERVAALLADVAALAQRLRKPLSARLFLVPGAPPGALTTFDSPYLTNTQVLPVT